MLVPCRPLLGSFIVNNALLRIILNSGLFSIFALGLKVTLHYHLQIFIDLFSQLIETGHSIVDLCWPIIQRLCQELPTSQAKQFVSLLLRLRASKA